MPDRPELPAHEIAALVICARDNAALHELLASLCKWRKAHERSWNREDGAETDAALMVLDDAIRLKDASEAREADDMRGAA